MERPHDAALDVVVEGVDQLCRLADGEGWPGDDGRQQPFEALARLGELGADHGIAGVALDVDVRGNQADDPLGFRR